MKAFQAFLEHYPVRHFQKGDTVLEQGDEPVCTYVIKEGYVKTFEISASGDEKPLFFEQKNEIFPMSWTFSKTQRTQYFYEAFTDCAVYVVPREDFIHFLQSNAQSQFLIFDFFIGRYVLGTQLRLLGLEQPRASDKIIFTLKFLCDRFGSKLDDDLIEIHLPLTQQDLANFVGLTRETTGIELKRLERQGIITYQKQLYQVHAERLHKLLREK